MVSDGEAIGWYISAFFGIGALAGAINLLPGSSFLILDGEGFTVRSLFRQSTYKWTEVEAFTVRRVGASRMVAFDFSSGYPRQVRIRRFVSAIIGTEGALPDTYGLSLQALADKMNAAKEEALRNANVH